MVVTRPIRAESLSQINPLIRRATLADCETIFKWRNRPEIIEMSTHGNQVSWAEHNAWFKSAIKGADILLFVIEPKAGCVRLDRNGKEAVTSIYLLDGFKGQGLGLAAIHGATREAFQHWNLERAIAYIRNENEPSAKAFRKAGYIEYPAENCPEGHRLFIAI